MSLTTIAVWSMPRKRRSLGRCHFGSPLPAGKPLAAGPAQADNGDWTYADHDFNGTRYSPLSQITPGNVKQLAKVCSYTFPEKVPSESAPIVSAG